jgi:hypothetical protein
LTNKVQTYYWISHHINFTSSYKYMCQMCFQCTISRHEMYKLWMNKFCTYPLLNYEMLSLWCRFENVDCKRSKQLEIIFQIIFSCELGQDISLCWWLQMWLKWGMVYLFIDGCKTSEWKYLCHLNNKHFTWIDAMHVGNLGKLDNVFIFFTKEINVERNFELWIE